MWASETFLGDCKTLFLHWHAFLREFQCVAMKELQKPDQPIRLKEEIILMTVCSFQQKGAAVDICVLLSKFRRHSPTWEIKQKEGVREIVPGTAFILRSKKRRQIILITFELQPCPAAHSHNRRFPIIGDLILHSNHHQQFCLTSTLP